LEAPDEHVQNRLGLEDRSMKWAIREKIGAGFGLALLILVLIAVVSYRNTVQLIETGRLVAQTHALLGTLESVRAHMTEIETGARGYVITADDRYLEPYYAARAEIDQNIGDLGQLVANDRDQQEHVETLSALIAERMTLSTDMVDLRKQGGVSPHAKWS
jgi:CHASE3 domain sensor protein